MSAFTLFTAGLACLAPFVNAYHAPTGDGPVGNPIVLPGTGSVLPVGQDYTVKWTPTTNGTVSLILLKGPANNLAVVSTIADGIDNSGSYTWKPSTDLTPGPTETTGYGIQLIVDATGQYQYTTQFGISNPQGGDHSSWSSSPWDHSWASSSWGPSATSSWASDALSAYQTSSWTTDAATTNTDAASTTTAVSMITSWSNISSTIPITTAVATSAPVTLATSTVSVMVSTSSRTPSSTTSAPAASSTGGAASLKSSIVGLLAVAAVAIFAL